MASSIRDRPTARISSETINALEELARRGFLLFPVRPRAKAPLLHGWQAKASPDLRTIHAWVKRNPDCNWGVAMGPRSGVFVLDEDGGAGRESLAALERQYGSLPATLTSLTGRRDGGKHRWFRYPVDLEIRNSTGKLGWQQTEGLDVKSTGGYVVVPPSIHESGRAYQWFDPTVPIEAAPGWLLNLVSTPSRRVERSSETGKQIGRSQSPNGAPNFNMMRARKKHRPRPRFEVLVKGDRSRALFRYACALRRSGAEQNEIEDLLLSANERCCKPPLPPRKITELARDVACRYQSGGPDPLESAWDAVLSEQLVRGYPQYLALAWNLQQQLGEHSIALPVERIGELMNVHRTQVSRWRKRALRDGWLLQAEPAIAHQLAACFFFKTDP